MEHYILIVRSVTHAQHAIRTLEKCGIRASMFRPPVSLTNRGCSYAVRIRTSDRDAARDCLRKAELMPLGIYGREDNGYREVKW